MPCDWSRLDRGGHSSYLIGLQLDHRNEMARNHSRPDKAVTVFKHLHL
jgi:hypothetical protein